MDIVLAAFGLVIVMFSCYMLGHWFGYSKGEEDTLERVKHIRWLESLGYTAESYKEHQKGRNY